MSAATPLRSLTGVQDPVQLSADDFRLAMRQLASTVTLITASAGSVEAAMTATSVCSVSVQPPQLLACVNRGGRTHELIAASHRFAVNVLSAQQGDLARHYSAANRAGSRLTLGRWLRSSGRPPLLAEALVAFNCEVQQAVECATHTVFIGRIAFLACRTAEPLVYRHGTFGRFAEILAETPDDVLDY